MFSMAFSDERNKVVKSSSMLNKYGDFRQSIAEKQIPGFNHFWQQGVLAKERLQSLKTTTQWNQA